MLTWFPSESCSWAETPITSPKAWYDFTNCGYDAPDDPYVIKLLEQNIKGEQCAITVYNDMLKATRDDDPVTYNMALQDPAGRSGARRRSPGSSGRSRVDDQPALTIVSFNEIIIVEQGWSESDRPCSGYFKTLMDRLWSSQNLTSGAR